MQKSQLYEPKGPFTSLSVDSLLIIHTAWYYSGYQKAKHAAL